MDSNQTKSPASIAAAIIEWDRRGRLVDDESYVQNNAPIVARAFWALREALEDARAHIDATPHGDNCFLDAGRPDIHLCWCGKDGVIDRIDDALAEAEGLNEVELAEGSFQKPERTFRQPEQTVPTDGATPDAGKVRTP